MTQTVSTRVLVVDDDARERQALGAMVGALGFEAVTAADGREAIEMHAEHAAGVILTDLFMPRMDGFGLLRHLEEHGDRTPTIVLTGSGSIEKAIEVVHDLKAFWFLEKPVKPSVLCALIERAAAQHRLVAETAALSRQLSYHGVLGEIVGDSSAMRQVYFRVSAGRSHFGVGADNRRKRDGKRIGGARLTSPQPRSGAPFIPLNCAALPET